MWTDTRLELGIADRSIDPHFLVRKGPNFNCGDNVSASVAIKLVTKTVLIVLKCLAKGLLLNG